MTNTIDPVARWTREVAYVRAQAGKLRQGSVPPPVAAVMEHALTTCDALLQELAGSGTECERLRADVRAESAARDQLFDVMPMPCLVTDGVGIILEANRAAGALLNVSAKHLRDRQLLLFAADRDAFADLMHRSMVGGEHRARVAMRPRERKPVAADVLVVPLSGSEVGYCRWFLHVNRTTRPTHADCETSPEIESLA